MSEYSVALTEAEEKALLTDMISIQAWIENAVQNKARQCMDKIIKEHSDKQPAKISKNEREDIVRLAEVKPAAEKTVNG